MSQCVRVTAPFPSLSSAPSGQSLRPWAVMMAKGWGTAVSIHLLPQTPGLHHQLPPAFLSTPLGPSHSLNN